MAKKQKTIQKSNSVAKKSSYQAPDLTVFIRKTLKTLEPWNTAKK